MEKKITVSFVLCVLTGLTLLGGSRILSAATIPAISQIGIKNITATSAEINWVTDISATTQLVILEGNNQPLRRYPEPADGSLVTSHKVVLENLIPNTRYRFFVASKGEGGETGVSYNLLSNSGTISEFTTSDINVSATSDFRSDLVGPKNVYAGSDLYLTWRNVLLAGPVDHFTFESVTGLPSSISFHVICSYNPDPQNESGDHFSNAAGQEWCWNGNSGTFSTRFRVSATTAPGTYTANITVSSGGVQKNISYTFNVLPAPAPIVKNSTSIPPLPPLTSWESQMTTLGQKWCNGQTYGFGYTGDVWYYDGGRVYLQVGDYTKNMSAWLPCAENIFNQYENYVISNNGQISGYSKFPFGMEMHFLRYGDAQSKNGVTSLYDGVNNPYINGAAPVRGDLANTAFIRELAYAIDTMVAGEHIGLNRSQWLSVAVNGALGQIDELYKSDPWQFDESFMGGLLAESLIAYYDVSGDPRIPPAVKQMLDWYWDNGVNKQTGQITYNPIYVPEHYVTELNNLIIPAFAWYWDISGDPAYQQRGDLLFSHALDTDISYSGKIFSQNYKWSFDYLRYRSGNSISTIDPKANPSVTATVVTPPVPTPTTTPPTDKIKGGSGGDASGGGNGNNNGNKYGKTKQDNYLAQLSASSVRFNNNLSYGSRGNGVTQLQSFLFSQGLISEDNITGYFGSITQSVVQQFQIQQGIVTSGTPKTTGFGNVGSLTRKAINLIISSASAVPSDLGTSTDPAALKAQIQDLTNQLNALILKIKGQ